MYLETNYNRLDSKREDLMDNETPIDSAILDCVLEQESAELRHQHSRNPLGFARRCLGNLTSRLKGLESIFDPKAFIEGESTPIVAKVNLRHNAAQSILSTVMLLNQVRQALQSC